MRAIVCGGRDFTDGATFFRAMDRIHSERKIEAIIEGGQRTRDAQGAVVGGADFWAYMWATSRQIPHIREDADWNRFGRAAGPIRNRAMIEKHNPNACITFPGGAGTANMIRQSYECGLEVIRADVDARD